MIYRKLSEKYLLRFKIGDDFFSSFEKFVQEVGIDSGTFSGIGSFNRLELGFFDPKQKDYRRKTLESTHEVLGLIGNLSLLDGKPFFHVHVTVADSEFVAKGGHLFQPLLEQL